MDILAIPFHKYLNIEKSLEEEFIFKIEEKPEFSNHLLTIHACVQLSLAEASSGEFLQQAFSEVANDVIPVVRKTQAKYHRPAKGTLYSRASLYSHNKSIVLKELIEKRRTITAVKVEILDNDKNKVLTVIFDWFLQMKE